MQLVAYGAQDIYLTGNPQITFFKVVYRRHTNFALESIEQTFNGNPGFGKRVTCTISRNGDLIHKTYLRVQLPQITVSAGAGATNGFRWLDWIGHLLVKTVEIEIGGQRIDKHYGEWLQIWNELTQTSGHALGYANMVGNTPALTSVTKATNGTAIVPAKTLYVPLQFWFCRNPGLALPLIALQYHEIKINLEFRDLKDCYWSGTSTNGGTTWTNTATDVPDFGASLYVDYVYLDTEERRRYAQVAHEFLIDQLQFTGDECTGSISNKLKLNFNHPTKELIWVVQKQDYITDGSADIATNAGKQWFNWTDTWSTKPTAIGAANLIDGEADGAIGAFGVIGPVGSNPVSIARLQLNGHDRTADRDGDYYNLVQPYQHHTNIPSVGINVYSFALRPEEHQPSGTCNMSRIDSAVLNMTLRQSAISTTNGQVNVKVFALNYNVLRIMSGMGGLAYAN